MHKMLYGGGRIEIFEVQVLLVQRKPQEGFDHQHDIEQIDRRQKTAAEERKIRIVDLLAREQSVGGQQIGEFSSEFHGPHPHPEANFPRVRFAISTRSIFPLDVRGQSDRPSISSETLFRGTFAADNLSRRNPTNARTSGSCSVFGL